MSGDRENELERYLRQLLGADYPLFLDARPEPPAIRINTLKAPIQGLRHRLQAWGVAHTSHPLNPSGVILEEDSLPLSSTVSFFKGEFCYQGIASQLPVLALQPQPGETILDLAAAPGSKAAQIAAVMENRGRLWLNDNSVKRLQPLMANLATVGTINDALTCLPGQWFGRQMPESFDRVLVDAPCSGLKAPPRGTHARLWWSKEFVEKASRIQEQLLISALKAVKVGGILVYSTCSICPEEDEAVISRILDRYPVVVEPLPFPRPDWLRRGLSAYQDKSYPSALAATARIHPYPEAIEGFFIARLRKMGPLPIRPVSRPAAIQPCREIEDPEIAIRLAELEKHWGLPLATLAQFRYLLNENKLWLVSRDWKEIPLDGLVKVGLPLAVKKSGGWKLTNASVQFFRRQVRHHFLELKEDDLRTLFASGRLATARTPLLYHILVVQGKPFAIVSQAEGELKLRLPHRCEVILDPQQVEADRP